ncbi:response regulator transcription factor [Cryptosporangium arvum]|uniref:Response regulator with CheY-like receiver domain and winged-helix DNA-binding domain n=1 Tax=Cryptosporangium arvum DSM 44712 TaxID=927661 RepID=A0A010ZZ00_9ACTN|nr:response regulator transcription factor [Cryptosporangium arvum]EXG82442.1 response regulator with CheY-like receiver domain and winged-helix DNA-binding domain [Cryptosporangium arvum DSM 44712]
MSDEQPYRVLVVEDEPTIRSLLEFAFHRSGYQVSSAETARAALAEIDRGEPHLLVLDVMLPDTDGIELTRQLRASGNGVPVLLLTARTALRDRVAGLAAGADDYVAKPFDIEEVLLRVEAILRRTAPSSGRSAPDQVLRYADLELNVTLHEVHRAGEHIALSPTEFKLLRYLLAHAGKVVTKAQILDHVWSYGFGGDQSIIETYVKYLRRKVDRFDPPLIQTVRGVGYSLRSPR